MALLHSNFQPNHKTCKGQRDKLSPKMETVNLKRMLDKCQRKKIDYVGRKTGKTVFFLITWEPTE
jgi:hypothetical protein